MHRPLREPLYLRVWHLIRGLLFYNTIYWRRASDGLNMPSLSAEERERQRPARNLDIIRPRLKPRARLVDVTQGGEVSVPPEPVSLEGSTGSYPGAQTIGGEESLRKHRPETVADDGTEPVYVKRRRYRRRLTSGGSAIDRGGFIARVFGKK